MCGESELARGNATQVFFFLLFIFSVVSGVDWASVSRRQFRWLWTVSWNFEEFLDRPPYIFVNIIRRRFAGGGAGVRVRFCGVLLCGE